MSSSSATSLLLSSSSFCNCDSKPSQAQSAVRAPRRLSRQYKHPGGSVGSTSTQGATHFPPSQCDSQQLVPLSFLPSPSPSLLPNISQAIHIRQPFREGESHNDAASQKLCTLAEVKMPGESLCAIVSLPASITPVPIFSGGLCLRAVPS